MTMCLFCGSETSGWTILITGAPENPELGVECRRCSALSPTERKQLRDRAMARDLREALDASPSAAPDTPADVHRR
jgi:hypothetical protein